MGSCLECIQQIGPFRCLGLQLPETWLELYQGAMAAVSVSSTSTLNTIYILYHKNIYVQGGLFYNIEDPAL